MSVLFSLQSDISRTEWMPLFLSHYSALAETCYSGQ